MPTVRRVYPLACLFQVGPRGAAVREQPAGRIVEALTPGIMFHGLVRGGWVWRLPSLGGGYVERGKVREVV